MLLSIGSSSWKTVAKGQCRGPDASSVGVMSGRATDVTTTGRSLTLLIVRMNVSLTVFTPEDAVTVMEAVPYC